MQLNIFVETLMHFSQDSLMDRKFKRTAFNWNFKHYKCLYCHFLSIECIML